MTIKYGGGRFEGDSSVTRCHSIFKKVRAETAVESTGGIGAAWGTGPGAEGTNPWKEVIETGSSTTWDTNDSINIMSRLIEEVKPLESWSSRKLGYCGDGRRGEAERTTGGELPVKRKGAIIWDSRRFL